MKSSISLNAIFAVILFIIPVNSSESRDGPLVKSPAGLFRGKFQNSLSGRQFSAFTGIPYAKPPVAKLRFMDPQRIDRIDEEFNATTVADDCIQENHFYNGYPFDPTGSRKIIGNEDCLYLNVYTPEASEGKNLPVMIFIHGGAFMIGSGSPFLHGPEILLNRDVVLVTINYRLTLFGFLNLGLNTVPGNMGLKDQLMAIKWVRENIQSFGGDPELITIFGNSAGAASVDMHLHSPLSRGHFSRAITQSGTLNCPWAIDSESNMNGKSLKLAKLLDCTGEPKYILKCLQTKPALDLILKANILKDFDIDLIFRPIVERQWDGAFITEASIREGSKVPWFSGVNNAEGLIIYGELIKSGDPDFHMFNKDCDMLLPKLLHYQDSPRMEDMTKSIKQFYFKNGVIGKDTIKEFVDMCSDSSFYYGHVKGMRRYKGPSYQYYLTYRGKRSFADFSGISAEFGVDHSDELIYLFNFKKFYPDLKFDERDQQISDLLVDIWTNFAINGNPSLPDRFDWPESNLGKYMVEIGDELKVRSNVLDPKTVLWEDLKDMSYNKDEL